MGLLGTTTTGSSLQVARPAADFFHLLPRRKARPCAPTWPERALAFFPPRCPCFSPAFPVTSLQRLQCPLQACLIIIFRLQMFGRIFAISLGVRAHFAPGPLGPLSDPSVPSDPGPPGPLGTRLWLLREGASHRAARGVPGLALAARRAAPSAQEHHPHLQPSSPRPSASLSSTSRRASSTSRRRSTSASTNCISTRGLE